MNNIICDTCKNIYIKTPGAKYPHACKAIKSIGITDAGRYKYKHNCNYYEQEKKTK